MYQLLASRNFNEISQSVEKNTVTIIQAKLQSNKITKGCFAFEKISDGVKRKYAKNKRVVSHMIGSSGRSVARDELKLNSIDHGKKKDQEVKYNLPLLPPGIKK
jgi:hypothetical protein